MNVTARLATLVIVVLSISVFLKLAYADTDGSRISGIVKNQSGAPAAGASVRVKNSDRALTIEVISQSGGRYETPSVPAGKYTVQGVGGGLQSDEASVEVDGKKSLTVDLALTATANFKKTASMNDFAAVMPEGEAKITIISYCTDCHKNGLQEILFTRKDQDAWTETVAKMRNHPYGYFRSLNVTDEQKDSILAYLNEHFGPDAPPLDMGKMPKNWVTGQAAKGVVTELKLPDGSDPHDIAVDSTGIGWVAEEGRGTGAIDRFDPNTLTYTRIPLPGEKSRANAIAVDAQDRIWLGDTPNTQLVEYDPKTKTFATYPLPKPPVGSTNINTIRFYPDGSVWGTEITADQVVHLVPATKKVTVYPLKPGSESQPYGMAIDENKMVWFPEHQGNKVGKIDPETGELSEFVVETKNARLRRMAADSNSNLWFGEFGGVGKLAMIDHRTGKITEYPTPTKYSGAYSVAVDKIHNLIWFNEMMADKIASFNPQTKTFVEYPLPTNNSSIRRIELDPSRPNRIWFSGYGANNAGFLDVRE